MQGKRIVRFLTNKAEPAYSGQLFTVSPSHQSEESTANASSPRDNVAALRAALNNDVLSTPTRKELKAFVADVQRIREEAWELRNNAGYRGMTREEYHEFEKEHQLVLGCHRPMLLVQPSLAQDAGAQILSVVAYAKDRVPIQLATEFLVGNNCERAYVVDLDDHVFEVYVGEMHRYPDCTERFDRESFVQEAKHRPKLLVKVHFQGLGSDDRAEVGE